jgi:ring-1,2-phenylacetyl-CoA epoxidase subunit PaaC
VTPESPESRDALSRYLLAMADDELVIGYRDSEWTGVAPILEEDLAFSSIGLDEIGHARLFYALLHDLTGAQIDYRARRPDEYLHAQMLEQACTPRYDPAGQHQGASDWAYAIVRQYLYDRFDAERLAALRECAWEPLALAVDKVQREEKYHLQHGQLWLDRLASGSLAARERLEATLARALPEALGLFEPVADEDLLLAEGVLTCSSRALRDRWLAALEPVFAQHGLALRPQRDGADAWEPLLGGRHGAHTADWDQLWELMTSVYRLDPAATW